MSRLGTLDPRVGAVALVAFLLLSSVAEGSAQQQQVIPGRVVDDATNQPVGGAIVGAETAGSELVGQTLTNESGTFLLRLPGGASFERIQVERIGYRTETFERSGLPATGPWELRVGTEPIILEGLGVEGENLCGTQLRSSGGVMTIWEEARKSLRLTELSREIRIQEFETEQYERIYGGDGSPRGTGDSRIRNVRADKPYRTLTVDQMTRDGWVHGRAISGLTYFAPDAFLLLSEEFTDHHCFSAEYADGATLLRFQPNRNRLRHTEIQGVMELDPVTAELEALRFRYVGLSNTGLRRAQVAEEVAGGQVLFYSAPNGLRVVRDWSIRMPVLTMVQQRVGLTVVNELRVDQVREHGGRILRVHMEGGVVEVPANDDSNR